VRCPRCNKPTIVLEVQHVEIDHCLGCGGVWLDAGELELLLEGASNKNELMSGLESFARCKEERLRCPICSKKLEKIQYGSGGELVLDKCPRNHGLWFDRDELGRALQAGHFQGRPVFEMLNEVFGGSGPE